MTVTGRIDGVPSEVWHEGMRARQSAGSAHPDAVRTMLAAQDEELAALAEQWAVRRRAVAAAASKAGTTLLCGQAVRRS